MWDYVPICPYTRLQRHTDGECVYPGDQAENLMIRASRGSGIAGLASISQASWCFLGTCLSQATSQLHTWPFDFCTALAPYYCSSLHQEEVHRRKHFGVAFACCCTMIDPRWQQTLIAALCMPLDLQFIPELCTQILIIPCY